MAKNLPCDVKERRNQKYGCIRGENEREVVKDKKGRMTVMVSEW